MSGLREIRDEMVASIEDVLEGEIDGIQIVGGRVLNPTPPTVDVYVSTSARDLASAGFGDIAGGYLMTVRARVQSSDDQAGRDMLLSFMDDEDELCVPLAVMDDPTLNGKAASINLVFVSGETAYEEFAGAGAYLGAQWDFIVTPVKS